MTANAGRSSPPPDLPRPTTATTAATQTIATSAAATRARRLGTRVLNPGKGTPICSREDISDYLLKRIEADAQSVDHSAGLISQMCNTYAN
ncbi:hypothetical protein GCM10009648_23470 [Tsukamurella spumae]